jgi:GTP cyclohydrolase I
MIDWAKTQSNLEGETVKPLDHIAAQSAVRTLLEYIGEDPDRAGLRETPARVAKSLLEMTEGLRLDPAKHLKKVFSLDDTDTDITTYDQMILSKNIPVSSLCEHHLLPFVGVAHVAYIPNVEARQVVGLSKLARLVEGFAMRPQVQERLTQQVADAINQSLQPLGVAVSIEAKHSCQQLRGVRKNGSMVTSAMLGVFKTDDKARAEFYSMVNR